MFVLPLLLSLFTPQAQAKDLREQIGVGAMTSFAPGPAVSVKYGLPTPSPVMNIQAQLVVGAEFLHDDTDTWFLGGRALYSFLAEDNLNLYAAGGVGWIAPEGRLRLQPAVGSEFFLFGLENLGLSAELGLSLDVIGGNDLITQAGMGMHYYF